MSGESVGLLVQLIFVKSIINPKSVVINKLIFFIIFDRVVA